MFAAKLTSNWYQSSKSYDSVGTGSYAKFVCHASAVAKLLGIILEPSKFSTHHIKHV